jgi:beta-fructofuranosidase
MHTMWECPIMAQLSNRPPAAIAAASPSATNGRVNGHSALYSTNGHMNGHTSSSSSSSSQAISRHMLCVSPDYCVNVPLCYLGSYAAGRFELDAAVPPQRLDLGDVLYAPNVLTDAQVRAFMCVWQPDKSLDV